MNSCRSPLVALLFLSTAVAQWHAATPPANPGGLASAGMAYDPVGGRLVMFGGDGGFGASAATWSFDGATWSQLAPVTSPGSASGIELAYDANRGVFVMYGSLNTSWFGGPSVDETWEFDGATWTQVFPTTTPGGLGAYGASFDSVRNRVVVYGGVANNFFPIAESGTWEFDGNNWTQVLAAGNPGPLERPAMCFHAGLGVTVLFGGIDPQFGGTDTTWTYDGTNWTALAIAGPKPAPRTGGRLAYDSVRGVCLLTGGSDPMTGNVITDTWEFDGAAWTQIADTVPGTFQPMLAFMPNRRLMVCYGGVDWSTFSFPTTTYEYGARFTTFGSGCAGSNGVPALTAPDAPRLGSNYVLSLTNLRPAATGAVFVFGFSAPAPALLDPYGLTGCVAYVSVDVLLGAPASGGTSTLALWIPATSGLLGAQLFTQGVSDDPGVNFAGLTVSNAAEGVLGR